MHHHQPPPPPYTNNEDAPMIAPPPPPSHTLGHVNDNSRSASTHLDSDTRYRTCCCHVTTCSKVIAGIELVVLVIGLGSLASAHLTTTQLSAAIFRSMICLGFVGRLIYGLLRERGVFLIAYIVFKIIEWILSIIGTIILCVYVISPKAISQSYQFTGLDENQPVLLYIIMAALILSATCMEIWFLFVIFRCYKYFKEKQMIGANNFQMNTNITSTTTTMSYPTQPTQSLVV